MSTIINRPRDFFRSHAFNRNLMKIDCITDQQNVRPKKYAPAGS